MPAKTLATLLRDHKDIIRGGDIEVAHHKFTTGVLALNKAISIDGFIPGGRVVQLIGEPKNGKSTLASDMVAQAQRSGIRELQIPDGKGTRIVNALWLDFEHSFDPAYAAHIGIDLSKLLIIESRWGEESFDIAEAFLTEGLQCIVVDSIPMFEPQSEEDKSFGDSEKVSSSAGPLTRILRRMLHLTAAADALLILINQYRANISSMSRKEKKAYGARAIQYIARVTIELVRTKNSDNVAEVTAVVEKTKLGPERKQVVFDIIYGQGIDYAGHIIDEAVEAGIVEKKGAWYYYGDVSAQGKDKAKVLFPIDTIRSILMTGEII
jgi:recombination protein RecA